MKKIATTALLLSLALAACSNGEDKPETTPVQNDGKTTTTNTATKTNTTPTNPTTPTDTKKPAETLVITADEVDVFLKTIPKIGEYTYSVETGADAYSAMATSDKDRKTYVVAKDSSYFKVVTTDNKEEGIDTTLPIQAVKAQRVLFDYFKNKPELTVELQSAQQNLAFFEVFELVDKGEATEHRNRYDTVVFNTQNSTFKSEEGKNDYSSLKIQ